MFSFSQGNKSNIDNLNGFKRFKFGSNISDFNDLFLTDERDSTKNTKHYGIFPEIGKIFPEYALEEGLLKFGGEFQSLHLTFYKDSLCEVKLFKGIKKDELEFQLSLYNAGLQTFSDNVWNELYKMFGNPDKDLLNKQSEIHYIWETYSNTLIFEVYTDETPWDNEMIMYVILTFRNKRLYNLSILDGYK